MKRHRLVGYFTAAGQGEPVYDPGPNTPCLVCWRSITAGDVRTISLLPQGGSESVFFRVHRSCAEADPEMVERIEHAIVEGEFEQMAASRG